MDSGRDRRWRLIPSCSSSVSFFFTITFSSVCAVCAPPVQKRAPHLCAGARVGVCAVRGCWGWCRGLVWPRPVRFHTGHVDQTTSWIGWARWKKFPMKISDIFEPLQTPSDCTGMSVNPGSDRIVAGITDGLLSGVEEQGCQHSQVSRGEPGIGGDVVGEGGEGDTGVVLGPPWRSLPRPVRGSAAGIGYLKVGEFTIAPPLPGVDSSVIDRIIRAWNVGAASARVVRSSASRRARSSGASGPQRRDRGASEEFSVMGSDRPLHWFVGRLEWRIRTPSPGNRGWISPRPVAWSALGLGNTDIDTSPRVVLVTRPWGSSHLTCSAPLQQVVTC